jgi:cytochrome P450
MLEEWPQPAPVGEAQIRDVHADLMRLTLEIACRTFFGADAAQDPQIVGDAMYKALAAIDVRFGRLFPIPDWFPTPANLRLRRAVRTLDTIVQSLIHRRRTNPANGSHDLLWALLHATAEDESPMTDAQLLDEARTVFLAGHETTALALTYALYLLAENPESQSLLQAEVSAVVGDRLPAHDNLQRLPLLRGVVMESMRLYPPADVLGREAIEDCRIGDVAVPRGTTIFMSQWVMHRDPRFFAEPLAFQPQRWTEAFERALPRFAYFPFGGGPRNCIGQAFAIAEAMLVLATICQRHAFAPDPTFKLELWPTITLRPKAGVRLQVRARGEHTRA